MVAVVVLALAPGAPAVHAQAFVASRPHPEFGIGPLLLSVTVGKDDLRPAHRPITVTVSWSVVAPSERTADLAQDLYLLWPGEVAGASGADGADPALLRQLAPLGFRVKEHGRLPVSARRRSDVGAGVESRAVGDAPFVTFVGDGASARAVSGATYVRIPWVPEAASLDWLVRLELPVRDVIVPSPVTWIEEIFWGRWYAVTLGFGDLGPVSLYPLYFGVRDRIVPLARDFSMAALEFADARRLRVDETVPASATRQVADRRPDGEVITLALLPSQGLAPQQLTAHFTYSPQRLPARPLLVSAALVVLGGTIRWLFTPTMAWIGRLRRERILFGRPAADGRRWGRLPPASVVAQIRPGETTYEDVRRLCGPASEERMGLLAGEPRAVVYREERVVPRRVWSLGGITLVRFWIVEIQELEITFERDRAAAVQTRVRRTRRRENPTR
jgi:hypothetical protein